MDKDRLLASREAIHRMGGPSRVANVLFGDPSKQNRVSNWKNRGIPGRYCFVISKLSGVLADRLCPPPDGMTGYPSARNNQL